MGSRLLNGYKSIVVALALMIPSSLKALVCFDTTTIHVDIDTSSYRNEISTKSLKADILNKAYNAMRERDGFKVLYIQSINDNLNNQKTMDALSNQIWILQHSTAPSMNLH